MRFRLNGEKDIYVKPNSLYIMSGDAYINGHMKCQQIYMTQLMGYKSNNRRYQYFQTTDNK